MEFSSKALNDIVCVAEATVDGAVAKTASLSLDWDMFKAYLTPTSETVQVSFRMSCATSERRTMYLDNIVLRPATVDDSDLFPPSNTVDTRPVCVSFLTECHFNANIDCRKNLLFPEASRKFLIATFTGQALHHKAGLFLVKHISNPI